MISGRTAEFFELLDDLRDEGLVTCREAGDTQYMDIVLHRLFSCLWQRICTCIYHMPSVAGSLSRHADNLFGGFNKKA